MTSAGYATVLDRRTFLVGIHRRAFLVTLALACVSPLAVEAQSAGRVYRVGILTLGPAGPRPSSWWQPFLAELREVNYVEGHNLALAYAGADARPDRLSDLAASLVKGRWTSSSRPAIKRRLPPNAPPRRSRSCSPSSTTLSPRAS